MYMNNRGILYHLHTLEDLDNGAALQKLLEELVSQEFCLVSSTEQLRAYVMWATYMRPDWPHWQNLPPEKAEELERDRANAPEVMRQFAAGLSTQLQTEIEQFAHAQGGKQVQFYAYSVARSGPMHRFEFSMEIGPGKAIMTHYDDSFFYHNTNHLEAIEAFGRWLDVTQLVYNLWHPIYAYVWDMEGYALPTDPDIVETFQPEMLYEVNLFGPEMVANLGGREYVLKTPAQIVRPLDDGGIFIAPHIGFYPESIHYSYRKAANYLGLACPEYVPEEEDEEE